MRRFSLGSLFLLGVGTAGAASAHAGHADGLVHGFANGALHPLTGLDHLAAIAAVALLAVAIGRRALLGLPVSFMAAMLGGFALGASSVALPGVEAMALVSGAIIAAFALMPRKLPVVAAGGMVAFFGLFHGHAHGLGMGAADAPVAFAAGMLCATAAVQCAIIGAASLVTRLRAAAPRVAKA